MSGGADQLLSGVFASAMNQRSELGDMRFGKLFDWRMLFQNGKCGLTVDIVEMLLGLGENELNNAVHSYFDRLICMFMCLLYHSFR